MNVLSAQALGERCLELGFWLPNYTSGGLNRVLSKVVQRLGDNPKAKQIVFLVDGFGYEQLLEYKAHTPFLRKHLGEDTEIRCGFPSTTVTSLASLTTGLPAGQTGLVGYSTRHQVAARAVNFIRWEELPEPRQVQRQATIFEKLSAVGINSCVVSKREYQFSNLTAAVLRGGNFVGAGTSAELIDATELIMRKSRFAYLYWSELDSRGHHYGVGSPQWLNALEEVDSLVGALVENLRPNQELILTADHGMVNADLSTSFDLADHPRLSNQIAVVAGEPRCTQIFLHDGGAETPVAKFSLDLQEAIGEQGLVLPKNQAIELGLFGERIAPHVLPTIGDVLVLATGNNIVVDSWRQSESMRNLAGVHGSLTSAEVRIPRLTFHG